MSIPNINAATYTAVLPSNGKSISFRPFNVREQTKILIAMQESDTTALNTAIKVIEDCTNIKVENLPVFDFEYLLLKIRSKSAGETIEMNGVCECSGKTPIIIDLDKVIVKGVDKKLKPIKLSEESSVKMKYPTIMYISATEKMDEVEGVFAVMSSCIDEIYIGEDVYSSRDQTKEDLDGFIDNLTTGQFKLLQEFFDKIPKISHLVEFKCIKCGKDNTVLMEGIDTFFAGIDES